MNADGVTHLACPGRNFAIAELCMLAVYMVQTFDFSDPCITERLAFEDEDWTVRSPVKLHAGVGDGRVDIIDLDGTVKRILHPGNKSDSGKFTGLRYIQERAPDIWTD